MVIGKTYIDDFGAFIDYQNPTLEGKEGGTLSNLKFAVKDLFDIKGFVTGCGNPDWSRSHQAATITAPVINQLVSAGATCIGKTHTDELAYSLNGENVHYGTPRNPSAPDRIPGGSSSGSATAVAAKLCDFALGTDTGGSIRIPASYCGIFGFRPTHGRISTKGVMPLAKTLDTVGWLANDPGILRLVGDVLLGTREPAMVKLGSLLIPDDVLHLCDDFVCDQFNEQLKIIERKFGPIKSVNLNIIFEIWFEASRIIQGAEVWKIHGDWIQTEKPKFGPQIQERFDWASSITPSEVINARELRTKIRSRLISLLGKDNLILMPTAPSVALKPNLTEEELNPIRRRILSMTSVSGLGGLPQVSIPLNNQNSLPVGFSIIGPVGADEKLLRLVERL